MFLLLAILYFYSLHLFTFMFMYWFYLVRNTFYVNWKNMLITCVQILLKVICCCLKQMCSNSAVVQLKTRGSYFRGRLFFSTNTLGSVWSVQSRHYCHHLFHPSLHPTIGSRGGVVCWSLCQLPHGNSRVTPVHHIHNVFSFL